MGNREKGIEKRIEKRGSKEDAGLLLPSGIDGISVLVGEWFSAAECDDMSDGRFENLRDTFLELGRAFHVLQSAHFSSSCHTILTGKRAGC